MRRCVLIFVIVSALVIPLSRSEAQQTGIPSIGVILQGGPWYAVVDGLREGLKERRLVKGKQFALDIRDAGGDPKAIEEAARSLERQKVALISDAMIDRYTQVIIDAANAKRLPTMLYFDRHVAGGGLASYGTDFHELGRQSAKHVERILAGGDPHQEA